MAQTGVDITLNVARDLAQATAYMTAAPQQMEKATQRAMKKTMRWLRKHIAKDLATALGVTQKSIKHRLTLTQAGKGAHGVHILWLGTAPMAVEMVGKPRQTKRGVTVGKRKFPGAFYRDIYGDGPKVWIRTSRARDLGLTLPTWGKSSRHRANTIPPGDSGRFPVQRVAIDIDTTARDIFRRYEKQAQRRFSTLIEQELNYAVNHER